jgi:3-oxoacyl-[acyl-carrier protein] reductase
MISQAFEISGKKAIVTGGGTGIGRSISLELAKAGVSVVIASRNIEHLEPTANAIKSLGGKALPIRADVRQPEDVEKVVTKAVNELGNIDILVNNSGANFECPFEDISPRGWGAVVDTILTGTYLFCRAVGKHMIRYRSGNIVNISSIAGRDGSPLMAHYGAAKAGIINLTKSLAAEWGKYNIRVNCIAPGAIITDAMLTMLSFESQEEAYKKWGKKNSLGHAGMPEDVAYSVLYLVSDAARFVTGTTLYVDGNPVPREVREA